mmetsp:Transcript_49166/g.76704  ORF Transcript_49166/g.76704 Transcript_49166/m.76704 type:complete len:119 (-) Transcript_49166:162-518(-)|eukprot:CAMPEP_0184295358 /NCGR_PEP_ID=MMETSP1049-20130417/6221_1 /TAXON_ID=77928 /ORGANISM="Proteomonas sulcata, Strain CCMP704" /LENGTH=118 /DNA_ID=CAMNT_0026603833 /DNA_START=363 /DNA_END=719 /DNA_ORIENTATION=-
MWRGSAGKPSVDAAAANSNDVLEKQNENTLSALQAKVQGLKSITVAINEEVHDQNKALEQMQTGMGNTDNLLSSTLNRLGVMYNSHGSKSVTSMAGAIVAVFLVLYFVVRLMTKAKAA